MNNPFSLIGKTILITGASSGIGKAIAVESAKMGAKIVATGRNKEELEKVFSQLAPCADHQYFNADLLVNAELDSLIEKLPVLDGVVHSAGVFNSLPFQYLTREKIDSVLNINFYTPIILSKNLLRGKLLRKGCSIVFISSIAGTLCSSFGGSIYSASKGAINGIVKGMALDLSSKGIRVNTICPGVIQTPIFESSSISEEQFMLEQNKYPLKRYGKPEEVAFSAIYLLSDASAWVTGSNLVIDGGYTLL